MDRSSAERSSPPAWRAALAFLVAPAIASMAMTITAAVSHGDPRWSHSVWSDTANLAFMIAYPIAILFELPAYLALWRYYSPGPLACSVGGLLIAEIGLGLMSTSADTPPAWALDWRTMIMGNADLLIATGIAGALMGLAFWLVAVASPSILRRVGEQTPEV